MNDILLKKLNEEQSTILNSKEKYMLVSACPGSGKTHTLVGLLRNEIEQIKDYQGFIACSFTNEASDEIANRLGKKYDTNNSYIGTIDSFIKLIVSSFINRALKPDKVIKIDSKISLPEDTLKIKGSKFLKWNNKPYSMNDITRLFDKEKEANELGKKYCNEEWLPKIKNSIYEVSFPSYFMAIKILKLPLFKDWFNNHFTCFFVDEAQDLNYFQHLFFQQLKKETNVRIIMLGDPNQSIYQFRGARPELFRNLVNDGYKEFGLHYSCRCNPNIMDIANRIYKNNIEIPTEKCVFKLESIDLEFLKKLEGSTFVLTDTNGKASELYNKYNCADYDIVFSKRLDFKNECEDYITNSLIVDELIKYFYNYDNSEDKYRYPFDKINSVFVNLKIKINKCDFDLKKYQTIEDFLKRANEKIDIGLTDITIQKIGKKLNENEYKYYYYLETHKNKIMTLHSSKGLESDNVVIYLTNEYDDPAKEEFMNKLFVGITRARNKVYILSENNNRVSNYINKLIEN